jgi:ABC-2 type transport system permease protein
MIDDIRTMIWKEWKETLLQRNLSRKEVLARCAVALGVLALLIWRAGPLIRTTPQAFLMPSFLPFFFLIAIVADSFAGERERHTLETLLASRLSDGAILLGKLAAAVLLMWAVVVVAVVTGLLSANFINNTGGSRFLPLNAITAFLVFYFLLASLIGCVGVLVSLRAATVRQAMQILNIALMVTGFGIIYAFATLPPELKKSLMQAFAPENLHRTEVLAALTLLGLNIIVFVAARMRFRRDQLILD